MKREKKLEPAPRVSLVRSRKNKDNQLLSTVRALALAQQRHQTQEFVSLRQAAKRFHVPLSRMAAIYRKLADNGFSERSAARAPSCCLGAGHAR